MGQGSFDTTPNQTRAADSTGRGAGGRFIEAVVSARRGRYAHAIDLLQEALGAGECSEVDALDLYARIYAQQGFYLQAESCWNRAKHLDKRNPAYDESLRRLRRDRFPAVRLTHLLAIPGVIAVLGLILWQTAIANPNISTRLDANERLLAGVRDDIAQFENASQGRDQEFSATVAVMGRRLGDLDSRIAGRLGVLPTVEMAARGRNAVMARLDERIATQREFFEREIGSLGTRRAVADNAQLQRIESIEAAVIGEIDRTVTSLEKQLVQRFEAGDAVLTERLNAMEAAIQGDVRLLPTKDDLAALGQTIANLQERLAQTTTTVKVRAAAPGVSPGNE